VTCKSPHTLQAHSKKKWVLSNYHKTYFDFVAESLLTITSMLSLGKNQNVIIVQAAFEVLALALF
jgi:hypothetical protein